MQDPHRHRQHYPEGLDPTGALLDTVKRLGSLEQNQNGIGSRILDARFFQGPYPVSYNFTVDRNNSDILILTSGSFFGTGWTWLNIYVDGVLTGPVGTPAIYNNNSVHIIPHLGIALLTLDAGTHTYQLAVGAGTSDSNDRAAVLIMKVG